MHMHVYEHIHTCTLALTEDSPEYGDGANFW